MSFEEFISTPLDLGRKRLPVIKKDLRRSENRKMLEIPVRQLERDSIVKSDYYADRRIAAFTASHRERSAKRLRNEEKSWNEEERYRRWRLEKQRKTSFGLRKSIGNTSRDRGVLERVVLERADYYRARENGEYEVQRI